MVWNNVIYISHLEPLQLSDAEACLLLTNQNVVTLPEKQGKAWMQATKQYA